MKKFYDTHHIIPRSRQGSNNDLNKIRLDVRKHRALHMLFDNKPPHEQLERIIDIASSVLTDQAKSDVIELLSIRDYAYWYRKSTYYK